MIYEKPDKNEPIKQGDIFYPLPILMVDLSHIYLVDGDKVIDTNWSEIQTKDGMVVNAAVNKSCGIVASQDCDASRAPVISFFEIGTFQDVARMALPTTPKKWMNLITQRSRINAKWFYLPEDASISFTQRMAINFEVTFQIQKDDLQKNVSELRMGRLNQTALKHYRESIAHFFRRYPYDEWYPLTKPEFEEYVNTKGISVEPFPWQK